eukprot:NODE_259_length_2016_cov_135.465175_g220_i0.p4 GENE.NODE_259_length_2016_cov_135.465175_g220_i0~~NODE_259_length_2016_cov_135.465175_g220_i0.p4  ORF type:complete len:114 (+),score=60.03 NODE_259_length_2016_cov_135.465175_g220_i0:31-342(+)
MGDLMKQKKTGTLNFVNPGVISHKQVLDLYDKEVDPTHVTKLFTLEEQRKILAADRSNCKLDTTKLESWAKVMPVEEAMKVAMQGVKETKPRVEKVEKVELPE